MRKKDTCFISILIVVTSIIFVGFLILPKQEVSVAERRKLASKPKLSMNTVLDGSYMEEMEQYLLDHIPGRDLLREITAESLTKAYGRKDVNGYIQIGQSIYRLDDALQEKKIRHAISKFQKISTDYFPNNKSYYAMIPDKNYFLDASLGYPKYDYDSEISMLEQGMGESQYIDLFPLLKIEDYYRTDLHWRQEAIEPVAQALLAGMGAMSTIPLNEQVEATTSFAGSYLLSSAYSVSPDTIRYLQNDILKQCQVYDYEKMEYTSVYSLEKKGTGDEYDIFLGGARALLRIENPQNTSGKDLIIFRDSFGSSIAPLLIPAYRSITLVDLRYVSADYALPMITWDEETDVLFLYQATMLNHSDSFR